MREHNSPWSSKFVQICGLLAFFVRHWRPYNASSWNMPMESTPYSHSHMPNVLQIGNGVGTEALEFTIRANLRFLGVISPHYKGDSICQLRWHFALRSTPQVQFRTPNVALISKGAGMRTQIEPKHVKIGEIWGCSSKPNFSLISEVGRGGYESLKKS